MPLSFDITILIRFILAVILGATIGLERELTNKYAGLRTNILVCLGSCVFTILSIYAFPLAADSIHPQAFGDPARIAAQILTGIGFIGGGTVLRHGASVYGLTTAATLWIVAAIGMACGTGMIALAIGATIVCVLVLVAIRTVEKNFLKQSTKNTKNIQISVTCEEKNAENVQSYLMTSVGTLQKISKKIMENNEYEITASIIATSDIDINEIYRKIQKIDGAGTISVQENYE